MDKWNPAELRRAIKSLPSGIEALSTAYGQAMCRINAQMPGMSLLAQKAMSWITYAKRLLSVVELQYALGVQPKASEFDEENLYDIADIISACGGLVVVDKRLSSETVRLVHFSTKEFLRQAGGRYFPDAQHKIATSCLTYLLYGCFREGWPFDPTSDEGSWCDNQILCAARRELRYPLLLYAAQHWASHASECSEQPVKNLMIHFLEDEFRVSSAAHVLLSSLCDPRVSFDYGESILYPGLNSQAGNPMSGMHLAVYLGIKNIVRILLDN